MSDASIAMAEPRSAAMKIPETPAGRLREKESAGRPGRVW